MLLSTGAQMKELDRVAIEERGIPSLTLMERAAQGIVAAGTEDFAQPGRAAVFAGSGNNGGDGVAAACLLIQAGWTVRVLFTDSRERMSRDCRAMAEWLERMGGQLEDLNEADEDQRTYAVTADLVIDAIFGVGLSRPVEGRAATAVAWINEAKGLVVAADLPSGLDADSGAVLGCAVKADKTITFTMKKTGHLLGESWCGEVIVWDIGIPEDLLEHWESPAVVIDRALVKKLLPKRPPDGHKGTFGKAYLLCGSAAYTGAPVLASRAAGRGGCGLVTVGVPNAAWGPVAARCLEEMPQALPDKDGMVSKEAFPLLRDKLFTADAALIGPGLGRGKETEKVIRRLVETCPGPLVLDADGINALEGHIDTLDARRGRVTVVTPHDGEFQRLGGCPQDRSLDAARAFAAHHGCVLVWKGHRTIVAAPDGRCYVNTTGNSGMAKGGSGDVLAGLLTSLLAQGMEAAEAAACAVWLHGTAGDLAAEELTAYAITAGDLIRFLPAAFRRAMEEESCG